MVKLAIFALAVAMLSGLASAAEFRYRFCKPTASLKPLEGNGADDR